MPTVFMVSRFLHYYGHATYYAPGRWRTADGVIPARLFVLLLEMTPAIDAGDQLRATEAAQLGQVAAENGSKGPVRNALRRLARKAVPRHFPTTQDAREGGE